MDKFENVDIVSSLERIMVQNTAFYQNDFDIDKRIFEKAVTSASPIERTLLWLSRPSGTHCCREQDVFLLGTTAHNTWTYYGNHHNERILAYAVEITALDQGQIKGNLYPLDYKAYVQHIETSALAADSCMSFYEHGELHQSVLHYNPNEVDPKLGKLLRMETLPNRPEALKRLLSAEKQERTNGKVGNLEAHIKGLHSDCIQLEALRILEELKALETPNSPSQTHFMVRRSPHFEALASTKDMERLHALLPFQTLAFSDMKDRTSVYALLPEGENRNKPLRKKSPQTKRPQPKRKIK